MASKRIPVTDVWFERAMAKTEVGECWIFKGGVDGFGYGQIFVGGKQRGLNRVSYEAFNGPIKPGNLVCHRCDIPACWNPEHLFQGTPKENSQDMVKKGRFDRRVGENKAASKLKEFEVREIRQLLEDGQSHRKIAAKYFVCKSSISNIASGRHWAELV